MLKNISRCNSILRHSVAANTVNLTTTAATAVAATTTNSTTQLIREFRLILAQQHMNCRKMSSSASGVSTTTTATAEAKTHKHTNRLAEEKSPYLLQHAHNPVDWYPWGPEAIERARTENKLIFLSVGYSTCHWCHVMEHESFESEAVAALMNKHFINIKVDREERPDIDKIYMQFVLMMNGSGGWPMSVWLTPDLAPITAGTYFPPKDRWGMPSFTTVLKTVASKWAENQEQFKSTGLKVIEALQKSLSEKSNEAAYEPGSAEEKLKQTVSIFKQRYDQQHGGFGAHPKFPEVSRLNFLFHAYIVTKDTDVLDMVVQTLHHMGRGGIHDHVFGGFARYSVDRQWHVPHFEKMLYDQGQLLGCYASAYKLTRDESFLRYADGIFRYLQQDLRHPDGGYFAGEDADSYPTAEDTIKVEGAFYAWTSEEIKAAITENEEKYAKLNMTTDRLFEIYTHHYDVLEAGNVKPFSDPHGHLTAKNILIVRGSEQKTCEKFDITAEQLQELINITNASMHDIRNQRPRPHLDTKIICAWNGLVLSGLAKLANCDSPKRAEYLKAAAKLVEFMRKNLYDSERQVLLRSCYGSGVNEATLKTGSNETIDGFLDDYAFLIRGLLDYYKSSLDGEALQWAKQLQETQDKLFWDSTNGAYYYSQENAANVIVRLKDDHDGAEPSGNSVATRNLTLLSHYFDEESYQKRATDLLTYFGDVQPFGYTLPEMMSALLLIENGLDLVAVVGPDSETTQQFVQICRKFYIPGMIIVHIDPQHPDAACNRRVQEKFKMIKDQPTVYICHDRVCRMPVTDPATLEESLQERFFNGTNV